MLIVTFLKSRFAVRSGGHNPNAGFASVDSNGLLIDTAKLNEIMLSEDKTLVRVGTGNRFRDVYQNAALTDSGKSIVGGRSEAVGVGGYYLGGGIGFFSNTYGISASQVRNFEVSEIMPKMCFIHLAICNILRDAADIERRGYRERWCWQMRLS